MLLKTNYDVLLHYEYVQIYYRYNTELKYISTIKTINARLTKTNKENVLFYTPYV
jgi:hypothetical protein